MMKQFLKFAVAIALSFTGISGNAREQIHDLVLTNGRVLDPASGLDAVRHVAISADGRIAVVSEARPPGRRVVDATTGLTWKHPPKISNGFSNGSARGSMTAVSARHSASSTHPGSATTRSIGK